MSGKHSAAATRPGKRSVAVLSVITLVATYFAVTESGARAASSASGNVRLLVQTKAGVSASARHALVQRAGGSVVRSVGVLHTDVVSVPAGEGASILKHYQSDMSVKNVEVDHSRKVASAASDPSYADQWSLPQIGWDNVHGSVQPTGVATIAVLDTGVDGSVADLSGRLVPGYSAFGSDPASDPNGHGTEVASIAAAQTDNDSGIAGVAYSGVSVMPVQVIGADGTGQDSDIIGGITWAADHGADVILMAFSNPSYSSALQDAISYAWNHGAVVVAATGNGGSTTTTYPAGDANVVGVSATDQNDALWSGSNSGADAFIGAPGVSVLADTSSGTTSVTGTSASAAMVAGAAALLKANDSSATNDVVVGRLARNADPAGSQSDTGNGRVNLARAIADTSTAGVTPTGAAPPSDGGPFIGPYTVAGFKALLQGQDAPGGGSTWSSGPLQGWSEGQNIPLRLLLTGGPGSALVTLPFPFVNGTTPGFQDLFGWTAGTGASFTTPALTGAGTASAQYQFTVTSSTSSDAVITFFTKMRPGAHLNTGSSLKIGDNSVGGQLQVAKPTIGTDVPKPDLSITKTGPATAGLGQNVTYTLSYNNLSAAIVANTPQITDTLPSGLTFVSCTGGCTQTGQVITWNLANLAGGGSGSVTVTASTPASGTFGTTYTNTGSIAAANQDDPNTANNTSSVTTTLSFNRNPNAVDDSKSTNEDTPLIFAASTLTSNDTDPDNDTLTVTSVGSPSHGTVSLTSGSITFTPAANYNGPASFSYSISDGHGGTASATVNVTVNPVNDAPTATPQTVNVASNSLAANNPITLSGSDLETASSSLSFAHGNPSHGTLTGSGSSLSYAPDAGYSGDDSFTFTVTDTGDPAGCSGGAPACSAALTSTAATVTIHVTSRGTTTTAHSATATYGDSSVTLSATVTSTITVNSGTVTFTVTDASSNTVCTATSGTVSGGDASASCTLPHGTNVGSYTITAVYNPGGGFNGSNDTDTLTVSKKQLLINADDQSKIYGAGDPAATYTLSGFVPGDSAATSTSGSALCSIGTHNQNVGVYTGVYNCAVGSLTSSNYSFAAGSAGKLTITKAVLTINADSQSKIFGDSDPAATYTLTGFAGSDTQLTATTGSADCSISSHGEDVGLYTGVYACTAGTLGSGNYSFSVGSAGDLTITKASSTTAVTCPVSVVFTGSAQTPCTVSVTGAGLSLTPTASYLNNVVVGTATASYSYSGDANHTGSSDSKTFAITKASSTTVVTCSPKSVVYTGSAQTPCTVSVTGAGGLHLTPDPSYQNNTNVGTATASYSYAGDANHTASSGSDTFDITLASSTTVVTCSPKSVVYTGSAQTPCTVTVSGAGLLLHPTPGYSGNVNVGTASASYTYSGDANHTGSSGSDTFAITKASSTTVVTCSPKSVVYNANAQTPCTVLVTGVGGLSLTPDPSYQNNTNVGTATASYSFSGDANHNGSTGSDTFDITQASSTTTITCPPTMTYTGSALTPCTVVVSGPGLSLTPTPDYSDNTNVGTATASYNYAGDANHTSSSDSKTFEITPASSTTVVTCSPKSVVYTGSALTPCTVTVSGAALLLHPAPTYTPNTDVGTVTASYTFSGDDNHTGSTGSDTFDITKAGSTTVVTCSPKSLVYTGSALTPCTVSVTGVGGLSLTPDPGYQNNTNVGTATASYTYGGDGNHTGSSGSDTFAITKAPSSTVVTCSPKSLVYTGSALTPCTVSVTGVGGLSLTPDPGYQNNTNVGTATASYTYAGDGNHTGSTGSDTFAITKASSTTVVTCSPKSLVYTGSALTPCTVSVTGVGGLSLTRDPGYQNNTNVGTATASYTYAGDGNHNGSSGSDTFAITKAPSVTLVTCPTTGQTYTGSAQTPCTVSVTGVGGLDLTPNATYLNNTNVGTATASYSYSGDANHDGSSDSKSFTITKATLTVDANVASKVYGANDPTLTYTLHGFKGSDSAATSSITGAGSCSRTAGETVAGSPYTITCTPGNLSAPNYTFVTGNTANFTICKAPLTITADAKSGQFSDPAPAFTVSYSGFIPGENENTPGIFGGSLSYTTTLVRNGDGTIESPAGPYNIHPYGLTSSNYAITFVDGTFTVSKENASIVYTGDSLVSTGSTASNSTTTVHLSASITEEADGHLGDKMGSQSLLFTVLSSTLAVATTCTAAVTFSAPYTGTGSATCTKTLGADNYTVQVQLVTNGYYTAPCTDDAMTVVVAGTGFTTGGGYVNEPNLGTKSNFGFTVKYLKNSNIQGNSLYIYRKTFLTSQVINGVTIPAGDYNWIIKSNAMTALSIVGASGKCPSATGTPCSATFAGKSTITAVNRATGVAYSLGGNNQFQVWVTDNSEPGSKAAITPDTYAIRVWDGTGTYYQLGTAIEQVNLNGGNIQVRP